MRRPLVLLIYNLLLPLFFIVAFPAWLVKMWKRGGYGTGLLERFAYFKSPEKNEPKGVVYVHAVSVGEALIALKLINAWLLDFPESKFVLSVTTSTGHEIARKKSPQGVKVIYSPLDFAWMIRKVFNRFKPKQIILIEAEAWPNLLNHARKRNISVSMVNARLSQRSEARYVKFSFFVTPLFEMVNLFCIQNKQDAVRFNNLGIPQEKIHITGSIKFDPDSGELPKKREEFQKMLDGFGAGRKIVMAVSTHAGEEKMLGQACSQIESDLLYVVVPRHAERRLEVKKDVESVGYHTILRSDYQAPEKKEKACLIVDSTGELRDWTAHADVILIGKSWLAWGGQSPVEAILADVPVICGPHMENFEPLITYLKSSEGITLAEDQEQITHSIKQLLNQDTEAQSSNAHQVLATHQGAVKNTIQAIKKSAENFCI